MRSTTYQLPTTPSLSMHATAFGLPSWLGDYDEAADSESREFNVFDVSPLREITL